MAKYLLILLLSLSLLFIASALAVEAKPLVSVYVYHQQPPYIINFAKQKGLYFDIVNRLNTLSDNYHFEVTFIPRKRVELMLDTHSMDGILLGVNPTWFKDKDETKYLWTAVIINDRDEVVSLKAKAIEYSGPDSLTDMVIGGVRGYYYYGINELVLINKANRVDTVGEIELLTMLLKQRVDVTIISKLTLNYAVKKHGWHNKFHLSATPHDIFKRRILVPKNMANVYPHLQQIVSKLPQDDVWQKIITSYK